MARNFKALAGMRSRFENDVRAYLEAHNQQFSYEPFRLEYTKPQKTHYYKPDFVLPGGMIIEAKGIFDATDRKKHLLVKAAHPHLDIRLLFQNPNCPICPGSKTTLAVWADKNGFKWAKGPKIPIAWLEEDQLMLVG